MLHTFGARLRQHRQRQGVSLESIAERTKIKASLLEGLERGDVWQWPPGLFRRAYVRAYAQALGLDAEATVREFLEIYPDPVNVLPPPPEPTRLRSLIDSALGSFGRRRGQHNPVEKTEPGPAPMQAPAPSEITTPAAASAVPAASDVDLLAAAGLCTELGRVTSSGELVPLLRDAAKLLGARGLIIWLWDPSASELRPSIVHGYSERVRARLRPVVPDADNATAAAFRSSETRSVAGRDHGRSALAVPLLSAAGCAGVLAIELPNGREGAAPVRATATFIAAVLAQLVAGPAPQPASNEEPREDHPTALGAGL